MGNSLTKSKPSLDLSQTPEEVLELILCYVPHRDVVLNCSHVCKLWYRIINNVSLWKLKCDLDHVHLPVGFPFDYKRLCIKRPFGRNLIKNCNASEGLSHWTIITSSGDGFQVEPERCPGAEPCSSIGLPEVHGCWATSYGWCIKSQDIDLIKEGLTPDIMDNLKPEIVFEDWTASRFDCSSVYTCNVNLKSSTGTKIDGFEEKHSVEQWGFSQWHKVTHTFRDYPAGVRNIEVKHAGKDLRFWAGHYGAKITGTAIYINVTDEAIRAWQNTV